MRTPRSADFRVDDAREMPVQRRVTRRRERLLAVASVLLLLGSGAVFALADDGPSAPPSIALDGDGPLFELQGMQPGDPPAERCVALTAQGGAATRLELSGTSGGPLASRLRMAVEDGSAPAGSPGATRDCAGFAAARPLWSGTLAEFPAEGAPAVSTGTLPAGERRVFRFRVWLPADAVVAANEVAEQTVRWRAELAAPADPAPPAPTPVPPDSGATPPGRTGPQALVTPCRGAILCRGRLIVRVTPRGARLHARIHAPGRARIRALALSVPDGLPLGGGAIALTQRRSRGSVAELAGVVSPRRRAARLTLAPVPGGVRTVLIRLRVPADARRALQRAACRRAAVAASLAMTAGARRVLGRMWIEPAACRRR
jgi:hypothetical protein